MSPDQPQFHGHFLRELWADRADLESVGGSGHVETGGTSLPGWQTGAGEGGRREMKANLMAAEVKI